jgi:hypothetical protein
MVTNRVWASAGLPQSGLELIVPRLGIFICIGCLEIRLGRRLRPADFLPSMLSDPDWPWHTPRLRARLMSE